MKIFGIPHVPLIARVQSNRKDPNKVVAFIGKQLCLFESPFTAPAAGTSVEVMITRPLHPRYPEGHRRAGYFDWDNLSALMIEPVHPSKHVLVAIDGFEADASGKASAFGCVTDGTCFLTLDDLNETGEDHEKCWLAPGRTSIAIADNGSLKDGQTPVRRRATNVWVNRQGLHSSTSRRPVRIEGLTRVEDLSCAHLIRTDIRKAA